MNGLKLFTARLVVDHLGQNDCFDFRMVLKFAKLSSCIQNLIDIEPEENQNAYRSDEYFRANSITEGQQGNFNFQQKTGKNVTMTCFRVSSLSFLLIII